MAVHSQACEMFLLTGEVTSSAGVVAETACLHPTKLSLFVGGGWSVEEFDTRSGGLLSRVNMPSSASRIVKLAASVTSDGGEFLLVLTASNELFAWDMVASVFIASYTLSKESTPSVVALTTSQQCPQCLVFYSRVKSPYIEVLPVDPTAKKPVQMDSVARLEPDPLQRRTGAVLAIAVHTGSFPFVAAGTADGCVSVWRCPFLSRLGSFHSSDGVVTFLSGELGGKDPVVAVAFHPTLPLLAGADASGHVIIWRLGGQRTGKTTLVCDRQGVSVPSVPIAALYFHPVLPRMYVLSYPRTLAYTSAFASVDFGVSDGDGGVAADVAAAQTLRADVGGGAAAGAGAGAGLGGGGGGGGGGAVAAAVGGRTVSVSADASHDAAGGAAGASSVLPLLSVRSLVTSAMPQLGGAVSDHMLRRLRAVFAEQHVTMLGGPVQLLMSPLPLGAARLVLWTGRMGLVCAEADTIGPGRCGLSLLPPVCVVPAVARSGFVSEVPAEQEAVWRPASTVVYTQVRQAARVTGVALKYSLQARSSVKPTVDPSTSVGSKRICWLPDTGPQGPIVPVAVEVWHGGAPAVAVYAVKFRYVDDCEGPQCDTQWLPDGPPTDASRLPLLPLCPYCVIVAADTSDAAAAATEARVSAVDDAVDVAILPSGWLLTVRASRQASVASQAGSTRNLMAAAAASSVEPGAVPSYLTLSPFKDLSVSHRISVYETVHMVVTTPLRSLADASGRIPVLLYVVTPASGRNTQVLVFSASSTAVGVTEPAERQMQLLAPSASVSELSCPLLPDEAVLSLKWQGAVDTGVGVTVQQAIMARHPLLCAVTTQRVLILSPDLKILASTPSLVAATMPRPVSASEMMLSSEALQRRGPLFRVPVTSVCWVASTVLVGTADGAVSALTATGRVARVASLDMRAWNPVVVCAAPDRLVIATTHWLTARTQIEYRAFCPLEPLLLGVLDHVQVRVRPHEHLSLLGTTVSSAAVAEQAVCADLDFVFQVIVRYSHPFRIGGGGVSAASDATEGYPMDAGVTRTAVEALWDAGLSFAAFYTGHGHAEYADKGVEMLKSMSSGAAQKSGAGGGGGGGGKGGGGGDLGDSDDDNGGDDGHSDDDDEAPVLGMNDQGFRRRGHAVPWWRRAEIAFASGRFLHALFALIGENPMLAEDVIRAYKSKSKVESKHLPSPTSVLAQRLRLLGRLCCVFGAVDVAEKCFDLAGDAHELLLLASIAEDPARLEVLRSSLASTYPALAAAAAAKLQQLSHTKAGVSAPPAGAPPAVRTYGVWRPRLLTTLVFDKPPVLRDAGVTPAPPVFVARDAGSDDAAAGSSTGSATSAPAVAPSAAQTHLPYNVRLAALTAALEADGAGPAPPPLLPTPFQPLAWTSPASWIGTRRMQLARGPSAASSGEEDATPALFDTGGGLTFDVSAMKSDASSSSAAGAAAGVGSGGGAAPGGAPAAGAAGGAADGRALIAKLKRPMLRMMGAGAEDCVVGYWRFEQRDGDDVSPYDVADLTKHSNNASIRGRGVGADTVRLEACDAPVDHGDPDRVKQPRALVLGPVGADSDGGKAAALFAALSASTLPSWPSADDVAPYAMIAPVPAWGYFDVGMRPEDPVTASFTVEVWVKLGSNVSSAVVVEEGDTPGVDGAGSGAKAGSSASPAPTVLAMRLEPAGPSSLRPQWAIVVEDGGVLAFRSYAAPSGAVETVRTPPGSLQKGVWTHLAVVVDGSSVARSGGKGGGGGGRGGGGFGGGDDDGDDVDRGPCCAVSMFIKGNQAARGFVANGAPYTSDMFHLEHVGGPSSDAAADGGDAAAREGGKARLMAGSLLLFPEVTARAAEVRVWASHRSEEQVQDLMDTHLDLADSRRKKLDVQIHDKDCSCPKCTARRKAAAGAGGVGAVGAGGDKASGGAARPLLAAPALGGSLALKPPAGGGRKALLVGGGGAAAGAGGSTAAPSVSAAPPSALGALPPPAAGNRKLAALRAATVEAPAEGDVGASAPAATATGDAQSKASSTQPQATAAYSAPAAAPSASEPPSSDAFDDF